jgi:plastocyanin
LVLAGVVLISACGSLAGAAKQPGPGSPAAATVEIKNYAFNPSTITIRAGQTVQWNFDDNGIAHNVIGDDGLETADLTSGTYRHTFTHAGTFNYHCSLHAAMLGVVVVN